MRIEIRSASEAIIEGYVNAVGRDSRILPSPRGKFIENIIPKTFDKALSKAKDVELRFNHKNHLGAISEHNLQLYEDNIGLYAKATVTDPDIISKAQRKELRGWSFGFIANADKWEDTQQGIQRRYLEDIELREVSILDKCPAYIATSIEMRDDTLILEERLFNDDSVIITDITTKTEEPVQEQAEEKRDYSLYEREIELLKIKGDI